MNTVTIVPPPADASGVAPCQGTQVLLKDGSKVGGVTRVELVCAVGDVWHALIHVTPNVGEMRDLDATIEAINANTAAVNALAATVQGLTGVLVEDQAQAPTEAHDDDAQPPLTYMDGSPVG